MSILQFIRRAIRAPLITFLAGDDLVIVGDIYCTSFSREPLISIPDSRGAEIIGSVCTHDGPPVIVPRGHTPTSNDARATRATGAEVAVPVSERLPDPTDLDSNGRCWVYQNKKSTTHWAPHNALPLTQTTELDKHL